MLGGSGSSGLFEIVDDGGGERGECVGDETEGTAGMLRDYPAAGVWAAGRFRCLQGGGAGGWNTWWHEAGPKAAVYYGWYHLD